MTPLDYTPRIDDKRYRTLHSKNDIDPLETRTKPDQNQKNDTHTAQIDMIQTTRLCRSKHSAHIRTNKSQALSSEPSQSTTTKLTITHSSSNSSHNKTIITTGQGVILIN